jgi:hypothetical protein
VKHVVEFEGHTFGLGREPLPRDDRDWLLRSVPFDRLAEFAPTGQEAWDRRYWKMVAPDFRIDQGDEGTCVGHGCTNVLMASPTTHTLFPDFADTTKAHEYARKLYLDASGDATYQEGTYTRLALNVLVSRGQIAAYYRLTDVDGIVDALLNQGPVTFGSTWYNNMFRTTAQYGNRYLLVDPGSGMAGGHLYCLTGVDLSPAEGPPFVRMENSWGAGWGQNGTARITIDDLAVLYDGDAFFLSEVVF